MGILEQHRLSLRLTPVPTGELFVATQLSSPIYAWKAGLFHEIFPGRGTLPTKENVRTWVRDGVREVFLDKTDVEAIRSNLETALVRATRGLSIGEPKENGTRALKLMALNLRSLYAQPHNDDSLMLQFQSTQNMGKFLLENRRLQAGFFHELANEPFHFTILQPMLSSLVLLGFLQSTHLFHEKEMETLFLTSYLKDIGMGLIPEDKYDVKGLSPEEQRLFTQHSEFSHDLLDGRVPLTKNQLNIIRHHHFLNEKLKQILSPDKSAPHEGEMVYGLESTLVSAADLVVAMTSARPYRSPITLFQGLELIRKMIADDHPQEFRALVVFLKQFFRN